MTKTQEIAKTFGRKLEKIMSDKNISANKLSQEIGIDRASITKYFKGESSPRLDTFLAICDILQVQPNYFLNADYNDYSVDNSRTEERKIIESLYCLCKNELLDTIYCPNEEYYNCTCGNDYVLSFSHDTFLGEILKECFRYATSKLADSSTMCKVVADFYEPLLIEYRNKNRREESKN